MFAGVPKRRSSRSTVVNFYFTNSNLREQHLFLLKFNRKYYISKSKGAKALLPPFDAHNPNNNDQASFTANESLREKFTLFRDTQMRGD